MDTQMLPFKNHKIHKFVTLSAFIFAALTMTAPIHAGSNLEVATDGNFSNQTTNFSAGQTVYVRISADSSGDQKHELNVRDNQYNFINSYSLNKSGSQFSASFPAPSSEGYYSLEARIESEGTNITSVKTIKVGSPNNANVKVNINNKVTGQSSTSNNITPSPKSSVVQGNSRDPSPTPTVDNSDVQLEQNQNINDATFAQKFSRFLKRFWEVIWPF